MQRQLRLLTIFGAVVATATASVLLLTAGPVGERLQATSPQTAQPEPTVAAPSKQVTSLQIAEPEPSTTVSEVATAHDPGSTPRPSEDTIEPSTTAAPPVSSLQPNSTTNSAETTDRAATGGTAESVWAPLAVLSVVEPRQFGAVGDGQADDTEALQRAIASLRETGGVVYLADGLVHRTTDVVRIDGDHVKLWARSGRAGITATTGGARRRQAIICQDVTGCGIHGVHFVSDASRRLLALEDSQVVFDGTTDGEAVGLEIEGSASAAIFVFGRSTRTFVEGNYIHHTWADAIHFTNGSRRAWVWDNTLFNESPTKGDDGVACVTYRGEPLCGDMEWWDNQHLGSGWGRGYSVIGGERVHIHDNFARNTAAAGILVASEPSYDTPGSNTIRIEDNVLFRTGRVVPHPGILISGLSAPITDVTVANNVIVDTGSGERFRDEGDTSRVRESNTRTAAEMLPAPLPDIAAGPGPIETDVLKTRDRSFVPAATRSGLYRIHVRKAPSGNGFEQRFEYVAAAAPAVVDRWISGLGQHVTTARTTQGAEDVVVVLTPRPVSLPADVREVDFARLRAGDNDGSLIEVWSALHP